MSGSDLSSGGVYAFREAKEDDVVPRQDLSASVNYILLQSFLRRQLNLDHIAPTLAQAGVDSLRLCTTPTVCKRVLGCLVGRITLSRVG